MGNRLNGGAVRLHSSIRGKGIVKIETKVIETGHGRKLHALIAGEGRPVLCLSGLGCSHYNFQFLFEGPAPEGFQFVLLDNAGMGKSSPFDRDFSIEDLAKDGFLVMDALGHHVFDLWGISMGGFIAQTMVSQNPDAIRSLVLMCTTSGGEDMIPLPKLTEEQLQTFYQGDREIGSKLAVEATVHPQLKLRSPEIYKKIMRLRIEHWPDSMATIRQHRAAVKFLSQNFEHKVIICPTLIMSGDSDRFVDPQNSQILNKKIKNSLLKMIPESDHLFFLERPNLTLKYLNEFMESIDEI